MDSHTFDFINMHFAQRLLPLILTNSSELDTSDPITQVLSTQIQQHTKDNKITLKQKDTFIVITKEKLTMLGDISLNTPNDIEILSPDIKKDGWHFLSSYLIDHYDMKTPIVIINQSKADKNETFKYSCGNIVSICGQLNLRVNVKTCKQIAPILKNAQMKPAIFNQLCMLQNKREFSGLTEAEDKQYAKILSKHPSIESIVKGGLLPLYKSAEMTVINFYLREGK